MSTELTEPPKRGSVSVLLVMLAMILAFLPSVLVFVMFAFFYRKNVPALVLLAECIFCFGCCFGSSLLLLRTKTMLAIALGILFALLNGAISLFFGCTTLLAASSQL